MPSSRYANLSIEAKRADKLKRTFDTSNITKRTYAAWCIDNLESSMVRLVYLKKTFPHYIVLENLDNRFIIEDTKANKIVKVEWKGTKAVCNDKDETYVMFALLHPDFRLV